MIPKLPLHSPRWRDLDGVTAGGVEMLLQQMASTAATGTGDAWKRTWTDLSGGLLDDGTVFDGAYAALPYFVQAAADLPPGQTVDFWVDLGCIVTAEDRSPVPADLEAGFGAALRLAEQAAVRSLLAADAPAEVRVSLALSCVAFAGHHIGTALWSLQLQEGHLGVLCPGCEADTEIPEFFVDPVRPPFDAPGLTDSLRVRPGEHPWGEVAAALRDEALGEGWEPFLRVAREVAAAGVPPETPGQAVLCLVAGMVAAEGTPRGAGSALGRELMLLTGHFRCWNCERTWTIADGLAETPYGAHPQTPYGAHPQTPNDAPASTVTSAETEMEVGRTGEVPNRLRQEGTALVAADGTPWGHLTVFSGSAFSDSVPLPGGGVDSLTVVSRPGGPVLVAGAGDQGTVRLWDPVDGRLVHDPLPAHPDRVRSMTTLPLPLPDGRVLLATGGETGTITLWDPATGRPVREPVGHRFGEVIGMCAATVPDGRTLLVTASPRGAVRLWDPATGESVGSLNPYGSPILSIAAVPVSAGHTLIAAVDTGHRIHVWDPAVDDPWERGAAVPLSKSALSDADHRAADVTAVPLQGRTVLASGDDLGAVMLWDLTTGDPVGDALPSASGTAGLPVMAATTLDGGRSVLVAGSRLRSSLRVWEPETGAVRHIALEVALSCLAAAGPDLIVGHDRGILGIPLTRHAG
ncbi:WD40 repeat domain-containing protein [Streptomyces sp. STR69]|uniref:WD40 repeat domain-containing protein n=1 Tax=Streptomyces sp. STR69 TaxID=1796942 RepID=UPI0021CA819D|nr:hypothetical protein [Streptomyces sp. STR69]